MKSCIYKGRVSHQRYSPRLHGFTYSLFMMYVDLDELPKLFNRYLFWSFNKPNIASFYRKDHHGSHENLAESIKSLVLDQTGDVIAGPIRLLTHMRYFGYVFNPLSIYFCYDHTGNNVTHVVAEVNNTPWKEQHCYVLKNDNKTSQSLSIRHAKNFHVSPFMNMDMDYVWNINFPDKNINIQIENWCENEKLFDASMYLTKLDLNSMNLSKMLTNFPLMTLKVTAMIHFEAIKLWFKGVQYVPHPKN